MTRLCILFLLFFIYFTATAQTTPDTARLSIGIMSYIFPSNDIFYEGSLAAGPSIGIKKGKVKIEAALLYDKNYYYTFHRSHYLNGVYYAEYKHHIIVPFNVYYQYGGNDKLHFILLGGLWFERRPQKYQVSNYVNTIAGTGCSVYIFKSLSVMAMPVFNFSHPDFVPAFLMSLNFDLIKFKPKTSL